MQAIKFAKTLQNITHQLKAKELADFLKPYVLPDNNIAVKPEDRDRFATLLFDSRVGFTELSRDDATKNLLDAFELGSLYESSRLARLISLLAGISHTGSVIGQVDVFKVFFSFYESLASLLKFTAIATVFLEAEKVQPPTDTDEVFALSILDYDGTGVSAVRMQESLSSLIALHTDVARILGVKDSVLKIAYTDSGSDVVLGLAATAAVIGALRLLFNEYWEKVKFRQFSEFDRGMQSLEKGLTINQKLSEQVEAKSLSEEEANVLKQRLLSQMGKLIGNGTMTPLDNTANVMPDERKLLTYMRDTKLLGTGTGEKSSLEPEKMEKGDTGDAKN
jgi:hypothetical protein